MRTALLLLLLGTLGFRSLAQQVEVTHYGVAEGLPQSMVNQVLQDAQGFIWLGTGDGLARFDGARFTVYKHDPEDSTALSQNEIWGIAQADPRHLFIGTRTGLDLLETRSGLFKHLPVGARGGQNGCWQQLWTGRDSVLFYSPLTQELLSQSPAGFHLKAFAHSASYRVRISADGRYMDQYLSPDTLLSTDLWKDRENVRVLPRKDEVFGMIRLDSSWLMLGMHDAWRWMDDGSERELPPSLRELVSRVPGTKCVERDANGDLWVGISGVGVALLRPDLSVKELYPLMNDARSLRIKGIFFDHQGNTWVGSDGEGVFRIAPQRIKFSRMMPGSYGWRPNSWFVRDLVQWDAHRVLISIDQGGLTLFDELSRTLAPLKIATIKENGTYAQLKRDVDGIIWGLDGTTLIAIDPAASRVVLREDAGTGRKLLLDLGGHLLVMQLDGVRRFELRAGQLFKEDIHMPAFEAWLDSARNLPHHAQFDPLGRLWSSRAGCLTDVWPKGAGRQPMQPFPMDVRVNQLFDNGDGTGWTCTNNGLYEVRWKDLQILRHLLPPHGPSDAFVYGMMAEGTGHRWISSNRGLDRATAAFDQVRNYSIADGLQSMEFNSNAFFHSASGRLYFGGINGFNHFLPGEVVDDPDGPPVALMRTWAQDSLVAMAEQHPTIELPYRFNRLELEVAVLEMSDPERATFRYRMAGFQDAWRTASPQRTLTLERIPAGTFTLEMQGLNADGVAYPVSQLLTIVVPLPYWASIWFNVLIGCALAAGIAWLFFLYYRRRRNAELQRAERGMDELRLRTRLAKDIHDDIGSGLARIAALSRSPKRSTDADQRFERLGDISSEMLHDLRDVVWMNNPGNGTLDTLLIRIREHATDLFEEASTKVIYEFPDPLPALRIGGRTRRNLLLVAKEALQNAHKYSGAKNIVLRWANDANAFSLAIEDDGCGITGDVPQGGGQGSRNMRQRAEEMCATYDRSSSPAGTTVRIFGPTALLNE
ncbi:MAG: two-component regulator propeller domain-containing protein [Flavobacteriales bacterium]